ncbi:MAG: N-acetylmuramoyl-L-alanine amidase [Thermoleophilia bacterium]|nr:N-acetylmuramoyl-L-alanine amidase [Thermoleophilia bacterium]
MHATGSGKAGSEFESLDALGDFFQRQGVAASHFAVDRRGRIMQYVREDQAAFHASRPGWNGISIGIELLNDNTGSQPFPDAQVVATRQLVQYLGTRYGIAAEAVVQHRDIQPEDRSDPAVNFRWDDFTRSLGSGVGSSTQSRRTAEGSQRLPL